MAKRSRLAALEDTIMTTEPKIILRRSHRVMPTPGIATKGFRSHSRSPFLDLSWRKKGPLSSLVQLRIAVWTGDARDTRPTADLGRFGRISDSVE
jgi:hypothetical protein